MRKRAGDPAPHDLVVFQGRKYQTAQEWQAAFEDFMEARERYTAQRKRGEPLLPDWSIDGDCPWDDSLI
jgi:hypothetical protein